MTQEKKQVIILGNQEGRLNNVVISIIKLNVLVFFLWYLLDADIMMNNFLVSATGVMEGRFWTLLTSVFSHNMLFHLLINMFVLYGFGTAMEAVLGPKRFLKFYLVAGFIGSVGHCLASAFLIHDPDLQALGASGAVSGVLVIFSMMYPNQLVFLLGFVPLPAYMATVLFVGLDLWGLLAQTRGGQIPIGHGAHLGGALTGLIYYLLFMKSRHRRRSVRRIFGATKTSRAP